jgi:hypothetical protein
VVDLFGSMLRGKHDTVELLDDLVASAGAYPASEFREHMSAQETTRFKERRDPRGSHCDR